MKDKRLYLKIGGILGILYSLWIIIDTIFIKTLVKDEIIGNVFLQIINIVFLVVLLIKSNTDIDIIRNKKAVIVIASIWLFITMIIPGVFGFIFLGSISKKKELKLPDIKFEQEKKVIKYYLLITVFFIIMFVIPIFVDKNEIVAYISYLIIFLTTMLVSFKDLKKQYIIFKNNKKIYLKYILKSYFYTLITLLVASIPILIFKNNVQSMNQQKLNEMFIKSPVIVFLLTTIYAPIVEESVFRLSFKKIINNKWFFIILSGIVFGAAHVIDDFKNISDILYIFQYSAIGLCLAKTYYDSKNIFTSMSVHFIQNFISVVLMSLLRIGNVL